MVVCFTCSPETKAQLDRLVASGHYHDHSEAISAAIQNLAVIHSELKDSRSVVLDRDSAAELLQLEGARSRESLSAPTALSATLSFEGAPLARPSPKPSAIPALFCRRADSAKPAQFADSKSERFANGKTARIDEWTFGQFNRLLPVKVTCRALSNLVAEGADRQPLEKIATDIAKEAAHFGKYLSDLDEKWNLGRDDALAVAFPKHPSEFKSIQRFANQFVASANREGHLSGLPFALKLIGAHPEHSKGVALTEAGWTFGLMTNPLLDSLPAKTTEKFTDEEFTFLLDHIVHTVPAEAFAYRTILTAVAHGILTPDALDAELTKLSGSKRPGQPFVSTQRSGAICRMADLDLIGRSRTATRVSYVVMPRGDDLLAKLEALEASASSHRA